MTATKKKPVFFLSFDQEDLDVIITALGSYYNSSRSQELTPEDRVRLDDQIHYLKHMRRKSE